MRTETFVTDDASIARVVRSVMDASQTNEMGKATYLRSIAAGLQVELGGKPVLLPVRGSRRKRTDTSAALAALERVNKRFYEVVLTVVNELEADALARNARSGFARSAVSTLRRAIRLGLNPATIVIPDLTKSGLREWADKHAGQPSTITAARGIERVRALVQDLVDLVERVEKKDQAAVIAQFYQELDAVDSPLTIPAPVAARRSAPAAQRGH